MGDRIDGRFDIVNENISIKNLRPMYAAQDRYEKRLSPADRELLDYARQINMTELQKRWFNDKAIMKKYWTADRAVLNTIEDSEEHDLWSSYLLADEDGRRALRDQRRHVIETYLGIVSDNRRLMISQDEELKNTLAFWGYSRPEDMKIDDLERFNFWNEAEPSVQQPGGMPPERNVPATQAWPRIPQRAPKEGEGIVPINIPDILSQEQGISPINLPDSVLSP